MLRAWGQRLYHSITAHPFVWSAALFFPLLALPQIDLTVSGWFFDAVSGKFPAQQMAFPEWVRKVWPRWLFFALTPLLLAWLWGRIRHRVYWRMSDRAILFLISSLALGPGLVVNLIFKEHWGRPRPLTLDVFGGSNSYVPPLVVSDQCLSNCSFSSGHGALGFWMLAPALLTPPSWHRVTVPLALLAGVVVGICRIAQGAHFLSDTVFSALVVIGITLALYRRLLGSEPTKFIKQDTCKKESD